MLQAPVGIARNSKEGLVRLRKDPFLSEVPRPLEAGTPWDRAPGTQGMSGDSIGIPLGLPKPHSLGFQAATDRDLKDSKEGALGITGAYSNVWVGTCGYASPGVPIILFFVFFMAPIGR